MLKKITVGTAAALVATAAGALGSLWTAACVVASLGVVMILLGSSV